MPLGKVEPCKPHPNCSLPPQVNELSKTLDNFILERRLKDKEANKSREKYRKVQDCIQEKTDEVHMVIFGNKKLNYDGTMLSQKKSEERLLNEIKGITRRLDKGDKLLIINRMFMTVWRGIIFIWKTIRRPIILIILGLIIAVLLGIPAVNFLISFLGGKI